MEPNNFEEGLIKRISECQLVVDKLDNDPAWIIIFNDLELLKQQIDNNWQEIDDEKKLERARVMKYAITHLMQMKKNYSDELIAVSEQLKKIQNPQEETSKDYDLDTNIEEDK